MSDSDVDVFLTGDDYQKLVVFEGLYNQERERVHLLMVENQDMKKELAGLITNIEEIKSQLINRERGEALLQDLLGKIQE